MLAHAADRAVDDPVKLARALRITRAALRCGVITLEEVASAVQIGERAEQIADAFQQRLIDAQRALEELTALLEEARSAERDRQESGMSMEAFSVAWLLNREDVKDALDIGRSLEATFAQYPHWRVSQPHGAEVRKALYRQLLPQMVVERATDLVGRIIEVLRRSER
jgi:type I restriction enzyme R subunit